LPDAPFIRRDPKNEAPLDVQKIAGISPFDRSRLAALKDKNPKMAVAIGALGSWNVAAGGQSDEENARMALQRCAFQTRSPCQITVINDTMIVAQDQNIQFRPATFKVSL